MTSDDCTRRGELTTWTTCRCAACKQYTSRLRKLNDNGHHVRIPSELGVAALRRMIDARMTHRAIATAAGVEPNTVSGWLAKLRQDQPLLLGHAACQKLLHAQAPTDGYMSTVIPRRKLRALARIGWSCDELTRRLQESGFAVGINTLWAIRKGHTGLIHTWLANEISNLYQRLEMTPGPSRQTVRIAVRDKWPGGLAWDDIDDANEKPSVVDAAVVGYDESRVERRIAGDLTFRMHKGESAEVVRRLLADGMTTTQILRDYGIKAERYVKIRDLRQPPRAEEQAA